MYFLSCVEIKTIIIIIIRKNGRARHARAEGAPSPLACLPCTPRSFLRPLLPSACFS